MSSGSPKRPQSLEDLFAPPPSPRMGLAGLRQEPAPTDVWSARSLAAANPLSNAQSIADLLYGRGNLLSNVGLAGLKSRDEPPSIERFGLIGNTLLGGAFGDPTWPHVTPRFSALLKNLELTPTQITDGQTKYKGIVSCLNAAYYGHNSDSLNAFYIGSWGKQTCTRPPRDVDLYFVLPPDVYHRFAKYAVNPQSALLQEVKGKLADRYPNTKLKGDGPVVLVGFESYSVEVVPAFLYDAQIQNFFVCDTKNGGRYKTTMPLHENAAIEAADARNAGNVRHLVRMLKCWQAWCSVPIKSFHLELLAVEFMDKWAHRDKGLFYYDWLIRDFFEWSIKLAGGFVSAPGTGNWLALGDAWKSRAESALIRARKACDFERDSRNEDAGEEWQKIFGWDIPKRAQ